MPKPAYAQSEESSEFLFTEYLNKIDFTGKIWAQLFKANDIVS